MSLTTIFCQLGKELQLPRANLSNDYFTNRCDRYYIFQDCQELCDYYDDLLNFISNCSLFEEIDGEIGPQHKFPTPNRNALDYKKVLSHHLRFFRFAHNFNEKEFSQDDVQHELNQLITYQKPKKSQHLNIKFKQSQVKNEDHEFQKEEVFMGSKFEGQRKMEQFKEAHKQNTKFLTQFDKSFQIQLNPELEQGFLYLFPTLQIPCIQYYEDEEFLLSLLKAFILENESNRLTLASGYLNLSKSFVEILKEQKGKVELITASPQANGFYKVGRIKSYIPYFYRQYELDLLNSMKNVDLYEFRRKKWTFHAKGIWLFSDNNESPSMTAIGSSNFSERSIRRDTEAQLYLFSNCPYFDQKMKKQINLMQNWSELTSKAEIKNNRDVRLTTWTKGLSRLFKSFL